VWTLLRNVMCFAPEGDLIGGVVVTAIGVDALLHLRGRREYRLVAALPIALGLHQIDETFVWWHLQGHVNADVGAVAVWLYLLFAFVALPIVIPAVVLVIEPRGARRWTIVPFLALGGVASSLLLTAMLQRTPSAQLGDYHIAYSIGLHHGMLVIGLYIVATCGSLLASRVRNIVWFGAANLVAVVILARLSADGFASLWCFYAALASSAIALHLRFAQTRDRPARVSPHSVPHDVDA
jgi:hypothetical protein